MIRIIYNKDFIYKLNVLLTLYELSIGTDLVPVRTYFLQNFEDVAN